MIITRIDGGLGNQMFQYAYGLYLAERHASELKLDVRAYAGQPQHGYLLDRFQVTAPIASDADLQKLPVRYRPAKPSWVARVGELVVPGGGLRRHKETPFGFHPRHLDVPNHRYLVGYWQSEEFFPGLRDRLLQEFQLKQPLTAPSRQVYDRIRSTRSLAVHIRRGDYINNSAAAKIYCQLSLAYYTSAIRDWVEQESNGDSVEIFVFSNDAAWCREHLALPWPTTFVDHNRADTAHEDWVLMSQAQGLVIANSTFSWWAAWLNPRADAAIYAPTTWFQPDTLDGSRIVPSHWRLAVDAPTTCAVDSVT
ncbi:MAG: alpha-1,2-fucosyltransferase [Pirellulaceae bacterium]